MASKPEIKFTELEMPHFVLCQWTSSNMHIYAVLSGCPVVTSGRAHTDQVDLMNYKMNTLNELPTELCSTPPSCINILVIVLMNYTTFLSEAKYNVCL